MWANHPDFDPAYRTYWVSKLRLVLSLIDLSYQIFEFIQLKIYYNLWRNIPKFSWIVLLFTIEVSVNQSVSAISESMWSDKSPSSKFPSKFKYLLYREQGTKYIFHTLIFNFTDMHIAKSAC